MTSKVKETSTNSPETSGPDGDEAEPERIRFSPEEEAALLAESNEIKLRANHLFGSTRYSEAIQEYDKALQSCPNYLEFEIAVLRSNIAACHLKLEDWKAAVTAATSSIESLDRLCPPRPEGDGADAEEAVKEPDGDGSTKRSSPSTTDIQRIRAKSLMRRAKARSELGGWAALQGADEDYKLLSKMDNLPSADRKKVQSQLLALPPRLDAAKEAEVGQMMGKLKELGNGLLKPFGLSTDNFNMVKDSATGGYSMQFNQGSGSASK
ncbi:hypothetical protein FGG08_000154 [Glutinoglossum americanum]|uniref:Tetratricopeptide repeat protein 1 n=1 Tax=Glutinoglossum americanum TaxID=1670608 RepID=A0A9P8L414_9PEZI|nr:hypothetical protein FGG08_000154 [Glutinoglossum americanum]